MAPKVEVEVSVLDKLTAHVRQMNETMTGFAKNTETGIASLTKGFAALGGAFGAVFAVNKIASYVQSGIEYGHMISEISSRIGMSTDATQKWKYVMEQSGSSIDNVKRPLMLLQKAMYNGNGALKSLGITTKETDGKFRETSDVFEDVLLKLSDMPSAVERSAMAQKIFGKGASEINQIVGEGSGKIRELIGEVDRYKLVLGSEMIRSLEETREQQKLLEAQWQTTSVMLVSSLMPAAKMWVSGLNEIALALRKVFGIEEAENERAQEVASLTEKIRILKSEMQGKVLTDYLYINGDFIKVSDMKAQLADYEKQLQSLKKPGKTERGGGGEKRQTAADAQKLIDSLSEGLDNDVIWGVKKLYDSMDEAALEGQEKNAKDMNEFLDKYYDDMMRGIEKCAVDIVKQQDEIKEKMESRAKTFVRLGSEMGKNFAQGISEGDVKKALKGVTSDILDFLHDLLLQAIAANTLKNIMVAPPGAWFIGAIKGAIEAAAITAIFETAKASMTNKASGGWGEGWIRAGEQGPENIYLPQPGYIYNTTETKNMDQSRHTTLNVTIQDSSGNITDKIRTQLRSSAGDQLVRDLRTKIAQAY